MQLSPCTRYTQLCFIPSWELLPVLWTETVIWSQLASLTHFDNMQFCQSHQPKSTKVHSLKTIWLLPHSTTENSTCKHNSTATFSTTTYKPSTLPHLSNNRQTEKRLSCQKPERSIKTDLWGVHVCCACKGCDLNCHLMHAGERVRTLFIFCAEAIIAAGIEMARRWADYSPAT